MVGGSGLSNQDKGSPGGLPVSVMEPGRFLKLFYDPIAYDIQTKTKLYLHILRIDAGDFDLKALFNELSNISLTYVLSRQNVEKYLADPSRMMEFANKVRSQFKPPDPNAGEGGELLLYSFLEAHLGAPKILSKMELKTSTAHYIHGSDGVHLLEVAPGDYQLIFGESKMYGDAKDRPGTSVRRGLKAAFKSIGDLHEAGLGFDTWLVESELLKETLDAEQVKALAAILLPPASGEGSAQKSNDFGIFVGYELDVVAYPFGDHTREEIAQYLRGLAQDLIAAEIEAIKDEIKTRGLGGYCFHLYAVPFLKRHVNGTVKGIEDARVDLATELSGRAENAR
ncbi:hypothetical protein MDOR_37730 [Mycolicibacterium doricum]|uniref:Anti-bacteriophage protein A/HamA C-terminal domain-containing protein n=2 Tax=Mycolicibacterium doricum TaxID=126673 RepID=A0A7I7VWC6_9MYCO|nr:hypothetical protein MDOR_37730 [Mycolicibacterium doricum]